ncbi:recombinase family protein [Azospirillum sp. B2RO_4]|uniref:recombinase family protein n=1 Tax=Azospirillum sp. B2RO_4 TaxID=3027796 RepID=UPI003DA81A54
MARYVAYLRVSTQRQGASRLGLEAQQVAVAAHASRETDQIVETFVEVESGRNSDRPQLQRALHLCKLTGATLLIAKLDRLARSVAFIANLMESGVEFVAADLPYANKLTVHILAAMAEYEREAISERTKAALRAARERGVRLGGPNRGANLRAQPPTCGSRRMRELADQRADDLRGLVSDIMASGTRSLRAIGRELDRRHVSTPMGGCWGPAQVRNLLRRLEMVSAAGQGAVHAPIDR